MPIEKPSIVRVLLLGIFLSTLCLVADAPAEAQVPPPLKERLDFEQIIATAKKRVYPALVFVKPIREEFGSGEKKRAQIFGSGVIISPDGLVVTNNHVAEKAVEINCVL